MHETARLLEQSAQARRLAEQLTDPDVKQMLIDYAVDREQRCAVLVAHQKRPEPLKRA